MKRLIALLPLGLVLSGCSSKAADTPVAAPPPIATETKAAAPAAPAEETSSYVPVAEDQPGMEPEIRAALKKLAVPLPPASLKVKGKVRVAMDTSKGKIILELDADEAPLHVKSFVYLAGRKYFDGTVFHRHADLMGGGKGYIIQGGDPLTRDPNTRKSAGVGGPGYQIPREYNGLTHEAMVIAAARSSDPNSAGSQFYITQEAVPFLDTAGDGYTVFGKVVGGQDVAKKLTRGDTIKTVQVLK